MFTCHNPIGIKYLTKLRLGFSLFRYHKFKHGYLDAVVPLFGYSRAIENTVHYFFHCPNVSTVRNKFLNEIVMVDVSIIDKDEIKIIQTILYGNPTYSANDKKSILALKYKACFGNQKTRWTNFLGKRVMVKMEQLKVFFHHNHYYYYLLLLFYYRFTFLFSFSILSLIICFISFCSSIVL